jgi:predicted patatin/cPLA2 family phospholipase
MNWRCVVTSGLLFVTVLAGAGCVKPRRMPPPPDAGYHPWQPVDAVDPFVSRGTPLAVSRGSSGVIQAGHSDLVTVDPNKPRTILALSGGGMYGSYTAGVLNGWSRSGKRPEFDVVTGISTGGLIAPMAFLGPDYDDQMKLIYTRVTRKDIFTYRNWVSVPFRDAVATTAPLRDIVDAAMSDSVILGLAAEHRKGRRLYVGTTNMDSRRFVTWDMGAIALRAESRDRADLKAVRKLILDVLIASCSLPGVFPPVPIEVELDGKKYTEMHMDGGVVSSVWVPTPVIEAAGLDPRLPPAAQPPAELYVVLAGKAFPDGGVMEPKLLPVLGAFVATAQAAQNRRDLSNLYHMARLGGVRFRMTAVAPEFPTPAGGLEFDTVEMNKLFEEGYRIGKGNLWWDAPPERCPGDCDPVRTGNRFRTGR